MFSLGMPVLSPAGHVRVHCKCLQHRDVLFSCLVNLASSAAPPRSLPGLCQASTCCVQVHGSLLQVQHLLEAHGFSLRSCEAQAVLPQTAGLLLERLWLATPLSASKAVRAAFLKAAGALLSAAHSAEPHDARGSYKAVTALARGVMGVCQEALIGQEQPPEPAHLSATPASPPAHDLSRPMTAQTAAQPALPAGSAVASTNGLPDSRTSTYSPADTAYSQSRIEDWGASREGSSRQSHEAMSEPAGADGADMMRSVFLKEAALLYFSPAMCLTKAASTGMAQHHDPGQAQS